MYKTLKIGLMKMGYKIINIHYHGNIARYTLEKSS